MNEQLPQGKRRNSAAVVNSTRLVHFWDIRVWLIVELIIMYKILPDFQLRASNATDLNLRRQTCIF